MGQGVEAGVGIALYLDYLCPSHSNPPPADSDPQGGSAAPQRDELCFGFFCRSAALMCECNLGPTLGPLASRERLGGAVRGGGSLRHIHKSVITGKIAPPPPSFNQM